jgi:hypothetical protein
MIQFLQPVTDAYHRATGVSFAGFFTANVPDKQGKDKRPRVFV